MTVKNIRIRYAEYHESRLGVGRGRLDLGRSSAADSPFPTSAPPRAISPRPPNISNIPQARPYFASFCFLTRDRLARVAPTTPHTCPHRPLALHHADYQGPSSKLQYGGEAVVVWYLSKEHLSVAHSVAGPQSQELRCSRAHCVCSDVLRFSISVPCLS